MIEPIRVNFASVNEEEFKNSLKEIEGRLTSGKVVVKLNPDQQLEIRTATLWERIWDVFTHNLDTENSKLISDYIVENKKFLKDSFSTEGVLRGVALDFFRSEYENELSHQRFYREQSEALVNLGLEYLEKAVTPKEFEHALVNFQQALVNFQQAREFGSAKGSFYLSYCYGGKAGTVPSEVLLPEQRQEAAALLEEAVERGYPVDPLYYVAFELENGGLHEDKIYKRALEFLTPLCNSQFSEAECLRGLLEGRGESANAISLEELDERVKWLLLAAEGGSPKANYELYRIIKEAGEGDDAHQRWIANNLGGRTAANVYLDIAKEQNHIPALEDQGWRGFF